MVSIRYFELLAIHRFIVLKMYFVEKVVYSAQIGFVNADDVKVFQQYFLIFGRVGSWYIDICMFFDVIHFCFIGP